MPTNITNCTVFCYGICVYSVPENFKVKASMMNFEVINPFVWFSLNLLKFTIQFVLVRKPAYLGF